MSRTLLIVILIISVLAFCASVYICIIEPTMSNVLIAGLLAIVIIYEAWQIRNAKPENKNNKK